MTLVKFRPWIDHENLNRSVKRMFGEMPDFFGSDSGFFPAPFQSWADRRD